MARFQNPFKIATGCVLSLLLLLFFFRQSIPYPQFAHDIASSSGGGGGYVPATDGFEHDVYSDTKNHPLSDVEPQPSKSIPSVGSEEAQEASQRPQIDEAKHEQDEQSGRKRDGRLDYWAIEDERMLPGDRITSQNGQYFMNLSLTGELKIWRKYTGIPSKAIFWTNADFQWVGSKYAQMGDDGVFQTWHHIEDGNNGQATQKVREQFKEEIKKLEPGNAKRSLEKRGYDSFEGPFRTWSSVSWPKCQNKPEEGVTALVVLTNTGALQVKHLHKRDLKSWAKSSIPATESGLLKHICEIFEGEKEVVEGDMGKLAVVLAGTMRSWSRCCKHINDKVLDKWPGSGGVDVFVATGDTDVHGYEEGDTIAWAEIQEQLNTCLNGRLRALEHKPTASETFPDLEATGGKCAHSQSQDRLLNQVKTVYRGGQLLMQHAIRTGTEYHYVLKMRPDHLVWGNSIPPFEPLELDVLKYPMPYWEPPTWSMQHTRISHSTPSDQMAFGRLLPMMMYFNLYPSYINLVRTSQEQGAQDYPPCYDPWAPCGSPLGFSDCFIEGLTGYWPVLNGIRYVLDWRWKVNLLREGEGKMSKEWRVPWNVTQGTRYVENGFE